MKYGYARVSTYKQETEGNSLDAQKKSLQSAGAEIIVSETFTGTKIERPEFSALIEKLQAGDTLIVSKLDRFARTAIEGATIIQELQKRGVTVHVLNMGIIDNTPTGKLTMMIFLAFAEFERDMIIERCQSGKQEAREQGRGHIVDAGRPKKFNPDKVDYAMELLQTKSYRQVSVITGISISTLAREKRKRRI